MKMTNKEQFFDFLEKYGMFRRVTKWLLEMEEHGSTKACAYFFHQNPFVGISLTVYFTDNNWNIDAETFQAHNYGAIWSLLKQDHAERKKHFDSFVPSNKRYAHYAR
jgi:hypothetical protein